MNYQTDFIVEEVFSSDAPPAAETIRAAVLRWLQAELEA